MGAIAEPTHSLVEEFALALRQRAEAALADPKTPFFYYSQFRADLARAWEILYQTTRQRR